MGRELRRVDMGFDWPLRKPWKGFFRPKEQVPQDCEACGGNGYSPEGNRLGDLWYGKVPFRPEDRGSTPLTPQTPAIRRFAQRNVDHAPAFYGTGEDAVLKEAQRLCDYMNGCWRYHLNQDDVNVLLESGQLRELESADGTPPTPAQVFEWDLFSLGHDSTNQYICTEAECKRLGISHLCSSCGGEGSIWASPEQQEAFESWEPTEPPAGPGYQMWETVSEGSPISPVFATAEELAVWLAKNESTGVQTGRTAESWLEMIQGSTWEPTLIMPERAAPSEEYP